MILLLVIVILVLVIVFTSMVIVPENMEFVVETLGKYSFIMRAGVNFKIPIIQTIKNKVDLKEHIHDFPPQRVITKDNVSMEIDAVVYCEVLDSYKYTYKINRPVEAIGKITATTLRNIVGTMTLDELLTARDRINAELLKEVDAATDVWGINITRIEVQNITPPQEIKVAMDKQMIAERDKRATILQAEATKAKLETEAEGKKNALTMEAEAKANAIKLVAQAEAEAIRLVNEQKPTNEYIKLEAIKSVKDLANGQATKIVVPSDIASITSGILSVVESCKEKK